MDLKLNDYNMEKLNQIENQINELKDKNKDLAN